MAKEDNLEQIYQRHVRQFDQYRLGLPAKKRAICFLGTPASGKTTLTSEIISRCSIPFLVYRNDDIRQIIKNLYSLEGSAVQELLQSYGEYFLDKKIELHQNQSYIFDSSIDRRYQFLLSKLRGMVFEIFVVSVDIPKNTILKNASSRRDPELLSKFEQYFIDHQLALENVEPDFRISNYNPKKITKLIDTIEDNFS
ncbi:MAG: hypothetical protein ACOCXP_00330 [Candidatus Dojkabacteria bacterium]